MQRMHSRALQNTQASVLTKSSVEFQNKNKAFPIVIALKKKNAVADVILAVFLEQPPSTCTCFFFLVSVQYTLFLSLFNHIRIVSRKCCKKNCENIK